LESINELELRALLKKKHAPKDLLPRLMKALIDPNLAWEEKRAYWMFLFLTHRFETLVAALRETLKEKGKVPFELVIQMIDQAGQQPKPVVIEALLKGMKKQGAMESVFAARGLDKWDKRLAQIRRELVEQKVLEQRKFKENLLEKFWFLRSQRMSEQAGRVLRRLLELYPEDEEIAKLKAEFDEQWARDILASHASELHGARLERTTTSPSSGDEEMLRMFLSEGEKLFLDKREAAPDLAMAFLFMEDFQRALEVLAWAPASGAIDWLRVELMLESRRFVEALEALNKLEVKYISDPESTFAVSYLRAQALHGLGQHASSLEILQSIVRVRPNYRSAHALILEWTEGVSWE
jgi:tetratricopeptide (TPR) repeat protein